MAYPVPDPLTRTRQNRLGARTDAFDRRGLGAFPTLRMPRAGKNLGAGSRLGFPAFGSGAPSPSLGTNPTGLPTFSALPSDDSLTAQGTTMAGEQTSAALKALADMINRRGTEGAQAISQLTGQFAGAMGKYAAAIPGIYAPAKAELAATSQALGDRLAGRGAEAGQTLDAQLKQAGQVGPGDVNLPEMGVGAGNAAYGTGIASLDALIARQAAAQTAASIEPGVATGLGLQTMGDFQRSLSRDLADRSGEITSQLPGLTQSIVDRLFGRRSEQQGRQDTLTADARDRQDTLTADARDRQERAVAAKEDRRRFEAQQSWAKVQAAYARASDATQMKVNAIIATSYRVNPETGLPELTPKAVKQIQRLIDVDVGGGVSEDSIAAARKAAQGQAAANQSAAEKQQQLALDYQKQQEAIRHNREVERNTAASTAERARAARAREDAEKRKRLLELAKRKTEATGVLWVPGPNGIHPAKDAKGRYIRVKEKAGKGETDTTEFNPASGNYGKGK